MQFTISEIAAATQGSIELEPAAGANNVQVNSLTWDSRNVTAGCLYVALVGERVDGHNFAAQAAQSGASCVLTSHGLETDALNALKEAGTAVVQVADTNAAVTNLARAWRAKLTGTVIGLTGSTGKTTTKNLVRDVLAQAGSVVATIANQNNELGVPSTLLSADADTKHVVVEMGMRGQGQIDQLCEFAKPDWGLITNVGESHIELLGSRENIARAKAELFEALPQGGKAFVNAADDYAQFVCDVADLKERKVQVVAFGGDVQPCLDELPYDAAVWPEGVQLDSQGCPSFTLCAQGFETAGDVGDAAAGALDAEAEPQAAAAGTQAAEAEHQAAEAEPQSSPCKLALRGLHNVSNACSAAAVGLAAGMTLDQVVQALSQAQPEAGRQEFLQGAQGLTVVNDAYNANPDSMNASLKTFGALDVDGKRIAVLGDMGELGSFAPQLHERVGKAAAEEPLDLLVCVGELSRGIAKGAQAAGMNPNNIVCVQGVDDALDEVKRAATPGSAVLVKASHFMELDRVAKGLVDE